MSAPTALPLRHLIHVVQRTVRMSGAEVLVVRRHRHPRVTPHLVPRSHVVVAHLHLGGGGRRLTTLLVEVVHLGVVGRLAVVLAIVVMGR